MFLIAPAIPILLIGILLTLFGRRGKRLDNHPICRRCRYDLHGMTPRPTVCPECGKALNSNHAFRFGNRKRRSKTMAAGALMSLAAIVMLVLGGRQLASGVPLRQQMPLWLLKLEMRSDDLATTWDAAREIARRINTGTLSVNSVDDLAPLLLDRQADLTRGWDISGEGEIMHALWTNDAITDEQRDRYLRQGVEAGLYLTCRERVRAGQRLPIALHHRGQSAEFRLSQTLMSSAQPLVNFRRSLTELSLEGAAAEPVGSGSSTSPLGSGPGSVVNLCTISDQSGQYEFVATYDITLLHEEGSTIVTWAYAAPGSVTVVNEDEPIIELVSNPDMKDAIVASIRKVNSWAGLLLFHDVIVQDAQFMLADAPVPVAFEIVCRSGTEEHIVGTVTGGPGKRMHTLLSPTPQSLFPEAETVDIIFRPSTLAAERTYDITEIWDGEIVLKDLQLKATALRDRPLEEQLRIIRRHFITYAAGSRTPDTQVLRMSINVYDSPIAGAWRIIDRRTDGDHELDQFGCNQGGFSNKFFLRSFKEPRASVTIILQPDPTLAEHFSVTDEIWFTEPIEFNLNVVPPPP